MSSQELTQYLRQGRYEEILHQLTGVQQEPNLLFLKITVLSRKGDLDQALTLLDTLEESVRDDKDLYHKARLYRAHIYERSSAYTQSLEILESLKSVVASSKPNYRVMELIIRGNISYIEGNFKQSEQWYKSGMEIAYRENYTEWKLRLLVNLANIKLLTGDYLVSRNYLQEAISINDGYGDIFYEGFILTSLQDLNIREDNLQDAMELALENLSIQRTIGNTIQLSYVLYQLVRIYVELDGPAVEIESIISELRTIVTTTHHKRMVVYSRYALALYKKFRGSLQEMSEAKLCFGEISKSPDSTYFFSVMASYQYCELLFFEFQINKNPDVTHDIREQLMYTYEQIKNKYLPIEELNILLLLVKLDQILHAYDEAKTLLKAAVTLAEYHQLQRYQKRIYLLQEVISREESIYTLNATTLAIQYQGSLGQQLEFISTPTNFTNLIIHDIKNLMTISASYLDLVLLDRTDLPRIVSTLHDNNEEIISLLDLLINPAPIYHSSGISNVDLTELISSRISLMAEKARTYGMTFEFSHPHRPIYYTLPLLNFKRAIDNLLINAIKHGDDSSVIEIGLQSTPDAFMIIIANECPPLPPNVQQMIFEESIKFRDNMVISSETGGLGLYTVKNFFDSLKASITVLSPIPNRQTGVQFTIQLPEQ